ncbi:MAG: FeoB-associated Cys-rich membrane protein [Desulfatiglandales bacterium]
MEDLLVIVIVLLAGAYIAGTYYRKWKKKKACGCACAGCDSLGTCAGPSKKEEDKKDQSGSLGT